MITTLFHVIVAATVLLSHLVQSMLLCADLCFLTSPTIDEIVFNYIEGTKYGDYIRVSPTNTLILEFYIRDGNKTLTIDENDNYSVGIHMLLRDDSKELLALYSTSATPIHYSQFKDNVGYLARNRIELKNLDAYFNNFRISVNLELTKVAPNAEGKNVGDIGKSAFFLIPVKPKIKCDQLNHNFDGDTRVKCEVTSHPAVSIVPTFASPTITSYDLTFDKPLNSDNHTQQITNNTFTIVFTPNLLIVDSKMGITAILDTHYTDDGTGKLVHKFEEPLTDHTYIQLKYKDLLKMECTKMFMLENDFAFKCLAANMKDVNFSAELSVVKTPPIEEVIKIGPWETEFHYRIRSDVDIVNQTVVVTVKTNQTNNSIQSIIKMELPTTTPPFNVTFTVNGQENTIHRLRCADLTQPITIACSAYSTTGDYHAYITSPSRETHKSGVVQLENLTENKAVFGGWSCNATNKHGTSAQMYTSLILEDLPCNVNLQVEGNISYHNEAKIHAIQLHQNVKFQCQSLSYPNPVVYSLHKIGERHQKQVSYRSNNGQFFFDVSDKLISGVWRCSIFNTLGKLYSEEVSFMVPADTESTSSYYHFGFTAIFAICLTKESIHRLYLTMILAVAMVATIFLGFLIVYLCLKSLSIILH